MTLYYVDAKLEFLKAMAGDANSPGDDVVNLLKKAAAESGETYFIMRRIPTWLLWAFP